MVVVGLAAMCFGGLAATSAATPSGPGPTLEGEEALVLADGVTLTANCNTTGISSVSWSASGLATGPFPGTFTASGTITIGPQTLPGFHPPGTGSEGTVAGPVLSFNESFTIQSATTTITGTKSLLSGASVAGGTLGTCQQVSQFPVLDFFDGQGRVVEVNAQTHYQATIDGVGPPTSDSGSALSSVSQIDITGTCPAGVCQATIGGFSETFSLSDQTVPPSCDEDDEGHHGNHHHRFYSGGHHWGHNMNDECESDGD
jgi:hypothetical protein